MKNVAAVIDKAKCNPQQCMKECIKYDPLNRSGKEGFHIGDSGKAEIDDDLVSDMHRICAKVCPFDAIKIVKLPQELKKSPIHQYGINGFRMFSFPAPIFGKVVGILGRNGIGKSTAIRILAGLLRPNLGNLEQEAGERELIDFFKGSEAQKFFEMVRDGKVKVSYKPQQVGLIPKTSSGTVSVLLQGVDDKGRLSEIAEMLDLKDILDHDIKNISGGELQRVAIAATVLKEANVYLFDEPTSFLDVKQRIKVSKFIQDLADENTAVMVIEHDLIILDYMADIVHLMYGSPGAYGIVSQPKSTREGINVYLSGYIREENMRFRDHAITFERQVAKKDKLHVALSSWKGLSKKLNGFSLTSASGQIYKNKVIGILGENGIGKTTFVRMLAGEIVPDSGEIDESVTVSYKPQYLDSQSEELVMTLLRDAILHYEASLLRPLEIRLLYTKKLCELSGGELQRVAVALCLSRDAGLYLMDEPSAYLDSEQRLVVSRVIRELVEQKGSSALIVDHDLLFVDYLSQDLIVFEGVPAKEGHVKGPFSMEEGMNNFLNGLGLTFRRDPESHRPRANKLDSQMDQKQKKENKLYYS